MLPFETFSPEVYTWLLALRFAHGGKAVYKCRGVLETIAGFVGLSRFDNLADAVAMALLGKEPQGLAPAECHARCAADSRVPCHEAPQI